jgi:hypothetical protein
MSPDATRAAFRDAVAVFRDGAPATLCEHRIALLRELVERRGHAWETEAEAVRRLINDSYAHALTAGASLRPVDKDDVTLETLAGLGVDERLELAEEWVARDADEAEAVVWLMFYDAFVEARRLQVGPVLFVDGRSVRDWIQDFEAGFTHGAGPTAPPQVDNDDSTDSGDGGSESEHVPIPEEVNNRYTLGQLKDPLARDENAAVVFARVAVHGHTGRVVERARSLVSGYVEAATLTHTTDRWALADGFLLLTGHRGASRPFARKRQEFDDMLRRFAERTDYALARLDSRFAERLAAGHPQAVEAAAQVRWERALAASPADAFRVALGVRSLERALPKERVANDHWVRATSYYLKDAWCWDRLLAELDDARHQCLLPQAAELYVHGGSQPFYDETAATAFDDEMRRIVGTGGPSRIQFVSHAKALTELTPEGSMYRRVLEEAAKGVANPEATLEWLDRFGRQFDALLDRTARQRNAIVHGATVVPSVLDGVLGFIAGLGIRVARSGIHATAREEAPLLVLERTRLRVREHRERLERGELLDEILARDASE